MKFKFGVKQIVLLLVAVILIGVLIAGNIILVWQAPLLHGFFGGIGGDTESEEAQKALGTGDQMVQDISEDSIVLLKNDEVDGKPYLPLDLSDYDDAHGINLFGWGATDSGFLVVGGGSGGSPINEENPMHTTLTEAFAAQGFPYNHSLSDAYAGVSSTDADYRGSSGSTNAYVDPCMTNPGESFYTNELLNQAKANSSDAIVVLSRWGAENMDSGSGRELKNTEHYKNGDFLRLTNEEKLMFNKLREKGFNVTVLLNTTNPLELGFLEEYDDIIQACLYVGIPGQSGTMAIPNILLGSKLVDGEAVEISPSGRLTDTYARNWQTWSPNYNNIGITGNIAYKENIYIGYKWYETAAAEGLFNYNEVVQFPFGYGLSYTSFEQTISGVTLEGSPVSDGAALSKDGTYTVTVHVKNTGDHAGKDVVQLYYTAPYTNGGIEKASINLLAFGKTENLEPGAEADVTLTFTAYDMASYDDYNKNHNDYSCYELDGGAYEIKLMENAHDLYEGAAKNQYTLNVPASGIRFETDPVTGTEVKNLFTGKTAYAGVPIDGENGVNGGVTYLSRADHFANYSKATEGGIGTLTSAANDAHNNYTYDGYNTDAIREEVNGYMPGTDAAMLIVALDDGAPPTPATLDQLNGNDEEATLVVQKDVLRDLIDDSDPATNELMWTMFLDQLTTEEICSLIGHGYFHTVAVESVGKPNNFETDGPAGFNSAVASPGSTNGWTVFPAETLSGCSWNTELMYELGRVQGQIGVATKTVGWYAPGVNLHRSPYNSRNYEYYSEDAVLSGHLAAETIRGAKEEGLTCYLKHFALAESGQNSDEWYEWITEQALRETYCKPFEIAVKEGGANAMMSAFNCVGAVWSGYNHALLTTMLREEWGFKGSVITDWAKSYMKDYARAVIAGNDLWLDQNEQDAVIDFDDPVQFYAARRSAGHILYTYVDTLYTSGLESVVPSPPPYSGLFVGLWCAIDIALGLGLIACCLFFFWSPLKNRKAKKAAAAAEGDVVEEQDVEAGGPSPDGPVESEPHDDD